MLFTFSLSLYSLILKMGIITRQKAIGRISEVVNEKLSAVLGENKGGSK